jgi:hypothetical protein
MVIKRLSRPSLDEKDILVMVLMSKCPGGCAARGTTTNNDEVI